MHGPARGFDPSADRSIGDSELIDFKGVIHCHSYLSWDSDGTIETIAGAAERCGLDFVVMTDHASPEAIAKGQRGMVGSVLFVTGVELRTREGTLLAFPLRKPIRYHPSLAKTVHDLHAVGALAIVGHAERYKGWGVPEVDGVEIYNLHAAVMQASKGKLILDFLFGSIEGLFRRFGERPTGVLEDFDRFVQAVGNRAVIAGNDAHENVKIFGALGGTIGTYEETFRTLTTHVLATELSEAALVEAIRRRRTYVVYDLVRDGTGFDFRFLHAGGVALMGDVLPAVPGELVVRVPEAAEIRLYWEGQRLRTAVGEELRCAVTEPGVYRVEVFHDGVDAWIFSSPIELEAAAADPAVTSGSTVPR